MKVARWIAPALLALAPALALAGDVETKFTRLDEDGGRADLKVAYATYGHKDSEVEVVLYGVIHIADKAYYRQVQKDLDGCDVVLYEGVAPEKGAEVKPDENMKTIGELQGVMGKLMGLQFQKDGIDYKRKNLVHADMTYEQLLEATGGDLSKALPGGNMFGGDMAKMIKPALRMLKQMGANLPPQMRDMFKMQMARQLASVDFENMPGGGDVQRIIIVERNKVAMKVLDKQLEKTKKGKIAIFYGAAHMKDFHERLEAKGWAQKAVKWHTAWKIPSEESDDDEDEAPAKKDQDEDERPAKKDPERTPTGGRRRWF